MIKIVQTNTIVLVKRSFEKNGSKTFFISIFPKAILKQEIAKYGGEAAKREYKQYLKTVGNYWILNGLQLVIAILSSLLIGSNRLMVCISILATLILIIWSIILLQKLKHHLAYSVWLTNKNVLLNNPS
jgi:hypothetical protein